MRQHPENSKRADSVQDSLDVFAAYAGDIPDQDLIHDLICNLGHYAHRHRLDYCKIAADAIGCWKAEHEQPDDISKPAPVRVHVGSEPLLDREDAHTALCVWECLDQWSSDPIDHPELTRHRQDVGAVALRFEALALVDYVNAVSGLMPDHADEGYAWDWEIVPAVLATLQWDCEPYIVLTPVQAAERASRFLKQPDRSDPPPLPAPPRQYRRPRSNEVFEKLFQPIERNDGQLLWDWEAIPDGADAHYWWTVIQGDSGQLCLCPGFHVVNRLGYVRCRVPRDDSRLHPDYFY